MQITEIIINNESGLHTRPGAKLVKACKQFHSDVYIENGNNRVNARSLIKLLGAGICKNHRIKLQVTGPDEIAASEYLTRFLSELED